MKRKKSGGGDGPNWMDTYGDMVTLLLCFFVLLYSMSTIDEAKWRALVQSFNPDYVFTATDPEGHGGAMADPASAEADPDGTQPEDSAMTAEDVEAALMELYQALQEYVQSRGEEENISVTMGDGFVFISLDDAVFFDGDKSVIREDGREVLDAVGGMLNSAVEYIDEVRILGHTAQGSATKPNDPRFDRMLASNRATEVLLFLQNNEYIAGERLVSMGYGQWRPISGNATPQERVLNRRVEMIVTGVNVEQPLQNSMANYYTMRDNEMPDSVGENPVPNASAGDDQTPDAPAT